MICSVAGIIICSESAWRALSYMVCPSVHSCSVAAVGVASMERDDPVCASPYIWLLGALTTHVCIVLRTAPALRRWHSNNTINLRSARALLCWPLRRLDSASLSRLTVTANYRPISLLYYFKMVMQILHTSLDYQLFWFLR